MIRKVGARGFIRKSGRHSRAISSHANGVAVERSRGKTYQLGPASSLLQEPCSLPLAVLIMSWISDALSLGYDADRRYNLRSSLPRYFETFHL
jgi:hypothetical protein